METTELFAGIAIVIDDEIDMQNGIDNLLVQIQRRKMPYIAYKELPDTDIVHLKGISFLLLDWKLQSVDLGDSITEGVKIPIASYESSNIEFLKKLTESTFFPIFIFTNEDKESIISILKENNLYQEDKPNFIFVRNKAELADGSLFDQIGAWLKMSPSVYVMKAWEKEYSKAKSHLFRDFYDLSPSWPKILWSTFDLDDVNMSVELGEVITRNLYTRMAPFSFEGDILGDSNFTIAKDEIRKVLQGERFIKQERLHENSIAAGDVFKRSSGKVFINIRPDCDCIPDRSKTNASLDDVLLYLLKGQIIKEDNEHEHFKSEYGHFDQIDSQTIVFSMFDGRTYDFRFKDLTIEPWSKHKDKRIGRLLPPHITSIQQRYSLYLQRQAMLRIPEEVVASQVGNCDVREDGDSIETKECWLSRFVNKFKKLYS